MAALCHLSLWSPSRTYVGHCPKSLNDQPRELLQWVASDEYTHCQQKFCSLQIQKFTRCQKIPWEERKKKKKKEHLGLAQHNLYLRGNKVLQSPVLHRFKYLPKFWILRHKVGIFQSGTIPRASGRCTPRQRHGHSTGATLEQWQMSFPRTFFKKMLFLKLL